MFVNGVQTELNRLKWENDLYRKESERAINLVQALRILVDNPPLSSEVIAYNIDQILKQHGF